MQEYILIMLIPQCIELKGLEYVLLWELSGAPRFGRKGIFSSFGFSGFLGFAAASKALGFVPWHLISVPGVLSNQGE